MPASAAITPRTIQNLRSFHLAGLTPIRPIGVLSTATAVNHHHRQPSTTKSPANAYGRATRDQKTNIGKTATIAAP
jgi:hypothetical protein